MTPAQLRALADKAEAEVHGATIPYAKWVERVSNGYYGTKDPATATSWGRFHGRMDALRAAVDPAPAPNPALPTLDVHELVLQPNNTDPGGAKNASAMWMMFTSDETPRLAPNGEGPSRFMFKGDHFLTLKMYEWLTDEGVGRADNWHAWAVPDRTLPTPIPDPANPALGNWEEAVSSRTFDIYSLGSHGHSGANLEANFEHERTKDTQDDQPHSGGMSVGMPAYLSERNVPHWLLIECLLGNNEDGLFRCWDWVTGKIVCDVSGINTISPKQTGVMPYEGGYNSDGVKAVAKTRQTAALYAKWRGDLPSTIAALLKDRPKFYKAPFGTDAKAGGVPSSAQLNVSKVQVPASSLA